MLHFDQTSNGREVDLSLSQRFEICLRENPTTGFRWALGLQGEPACTLVSDLFEPASDPPGQEGRHHWQFQAIQVGLGKIELWHRRPWEQGKPPAQVFTLQVHVRG